MRHDRAEEPELPYDGPFVVIEPVGLAYQVETRPVLPTGEGSPRSYATKHEAFGAARDLWTTHRLPLLDLTVPETARAHSEEKPKGRSFL